jgi:hypothetical protein
MPFYSNLKQRQLDWYTDPRYQNDTSALRSGDLMFFSESFTAEPVPPPGFQLKRVYCYYPEWLLSNNTNHWQERSRIWTIYQMEYSAKLKKQ